VDSNILRVIFYKSSSQSYPKAIELAKIFDNFTQNNKTNEIKINKEEIIKKIDNLENISNIICAWKLTEMSLDDRKITKLEIPTIKEVIRCSKYHHNSPDRKPYCNKDDNNEGWSCKLLTELIRHMPINDWHYKNGKHWYNYGHFENNLWIIDKEAIKHELVSEAKRKMIPIFCPYFDEKNIANILNEFPDNIDTDNNKDWSAREIDVDTGYSVEKQRVGIIPKWMNSGNISSSFSTDNDDEKEDINKNIPKVTFSEIGGLGETVNIIREVIELPIKQPQIFKHLGIKPHKGILLYGPPGCGKTLIAKAIANEVQAHFINIKGPELINKYIGQSEENLRNIFLEARNHEPSIIFFDEIDSIAQSRSGEHQYIDIFVNQLLTLMDGVEEYSNVRIIASTNRPELIDKALLRPGRFDYHIEIKKPTIEGCREIVKIYTKNMPLADDVNIKFIADKLYGYTGADIHFVITESAYNCIRRNIMIEELIKHEEQIDIEKLFITNDDILKAMAKLTNERKGTSKNIFLTFSSAE
jgi:transitional endoplasmic reticulum ATPase